MRWGPVAKIVLSLWASVWSRNKEGGWGGSPGSATTVRSVDQTPQSCFCLLCNFNLTFHLYFGCRSCRLSVTTQPLDVVYNPLVLDHISEFFSHTSMEGTQALHIERQLREVARVRYEELKNQTRAELVQTLDAMMAGSEVVSCRSVQELLGNIVLDAQNLLLRSQQTKFRPKREANCRTMVSSANTG